MIVFDASTLILLARIELLETFLASHKTEAVIPKEVERECCAVKRTLDALAIQKALNESKIRAMSVRDAKLVNKLQDDFGLGKGEAEAIALAKLVNAKLVVMDDKNGINACKLLGLPFTTAPGILLGCRERGLISREEAHAKVELLAKFGRYRSSIIEDVKARLEASQ